MRWCFYAYGTVNRLLYKERPYFDNQNERFTTFDGSELSRTSTFPSLVHLNKVGPLTWSDKIVKSRSSDPTQPVIATHALTSFAR